jgi:hypothetical protein
MPHGISLQLESSLGETMRQQTKPFIIERKPSRKPRLDAAKPSIWGKLDVDISKAVQNQENADQREPARAVATGGADRA